MAQALPVAAALLLALACGTAHAQSAYTLCGYQPDPRDLYFEHPLQLFCSKGSTDAVYLGLSQCSPHAGSTHIIIGNVSNSLDPGIVPSLPDGGLSVQSYNATGTSEGAAHSKYLLDLLNGEIFVDTDTLGGQNRGPDAEYETVVLDPESIGAEHASYLAALHQLLLDVSNVASPPAPYSSTCNSRVPELDSVVAYLSAAIADATR